MGKARTAQTPCGSHTARASMTGTMIHLVRQRSDQRGTENTNPHLPCSKICQQRTFGTVQAVCYSCPLRTRLVRTASSRCSMIAPKLSGTCLQGSLRNVRYFVGARTCSRRILHKPDQTSPFHALTHTAQRCIPLTMVSTRLRRFDSDTAPLRSSCIYLGHFDVGACLLDTPGSARQIQR